MKKRSKTSFKCLNWLNCGIFPPIIMLSCGYTYDEIVASLNKTSAGKKWIQGLEYQKELVKKASWLAIRTTVNSRDYFYIYLKDPFEFTDDSYCCLAHECLHICQYALPALLKRDNEHEAEAYLHTHLMTQCLHYLRGGKGTWDTAK